MRDRVPRLMVAADLADHRRAREVDAAERMTREVLEDALWRSALMPTGTVRRALVPSPVRGLDEDHLLEVPPRLLNAGAALDDVS